jgi:amino acid transporter
MDSDNAKPQLRRALGLADTALMIVAALVSLNTMAPLAQNGPMLLWIWPVALLVFFIPEGITVVELSQHYPGEGAVYVWPSRLLGDYCGFLSGWCYWMANVVYIPTLIVSSVGFVAYLFGASGKGLAANGVAIEAGSLGLLLLVIWLNVRGLASQKWLVNLAAIGTLGVGAFLIVLGSWLAVTHGIPTGALKWHPSGFEWNWVAVFSVVCFSLLGLEVASNVGGEIRNPRRVLPRAILLGALLVASIDLLLSGSMLIAVPASGLSLIQGVLDAAGGMAAAVGLPSPVAPLAGILGLAVAGTAAAWTASSARLPYVAAIEGHLPAAFARLHPRYASPFVSLWVCGALCAVSLGVSFAGAGINEAFQTILDLSVILSLMQYLFMFASLIALVRRPAARTLYFRRWILTLAGISGLCTIVVATTCAFIPTRQVENLGLFELKLITVTILVMGTGAVWFRVNRRTNVGQTAADSR